MTSIKHNEHVVKLLKDIFGLSVDIEYRNIIYYANGMSHIVFDIYADYKNCEIYNSELKIKFGKYYGGFYTSDIMKKYTFHLDAKYVVYSNRKFNINHLLNA
jgi:hypothetical protein